MEWQPIAIYDGMKTKPKLCVFYFEAVHNKDRPYVSLAATIETTRRYGHRVCTHFIVLPEAPK